jgi:hypothetical protein
LGLARVRVRVWPIIPVNPPIPVYKLYTCAEHPGHVIEASGVNLDRHSMYVEHDLEYTKPVRLMPL